MIFLILSIFFRASSLCDKFRSQMFEVLMSLFRTPDFETFVDPK